MTSDSFLDDKVENFDFLGLVGAAQEVASSPQFGAGAQVLRPLESLQEGLVKLG